MGVVVHGCGILAKNAARVEGGVSALRARGGQQAGEIRGRHRVTEMEALRAVAAGAVKPQRGSRRHVQIVSRR
jgi:hypothetical protein